VTRIGVRTGSWASLAATLVLAGAASASADEGAALEEISPRLSIGRHGWEERDGGQRIVKEEGVLFGAEAEARIALAPLALRGALVLEPRLGFFGGVVDYDGITQRPLRLRVKTDVVYLGGKLEADLGWRLFASDGDLAFGPIAGFGERWWFRRIADHDALDALGRPVPVHGYTELWQSLYVRLGGKLAWSVAEGVRLFAEGGAKLPVFTTTTVPIAGGVRLEPGGEWTAFAEAGVVVGIVRASVFYEGFGFSRSSTEKGLFQPDAEGRSVGVSLGVVF
jgi:hypothetical protein